MIPKIIHQTAPEDKNKWDPSWIKYQQSWIKHFPDFEYKFWNDNDIENFIFTKYRWFYDIYKSYDANIKRVDAARYFILYEYGGIYADMDYECVNNFWENIDQDSVSFAESGGVCVASIENALIVSPQNDPFWPLVFAKLINSTNFFVFEATGPVFIERCYKHYYDETKRNIKYLNAQQYSLNINTRSSNKYAIHHQTGVWTKPSKTITDKIIYHDNIDNKYSLSVQHHGWEDAFEINVFNDKITIKRIDCDGCGWGLYLNLIITNKESDLKIIHGVGSCETSSPIDLNISLDTLFYENSDKIKLQDTTLVCIDDINVDRAISAINKTLSQCSFDKVILLTSLDTNYEYAIKIDPIRSIQEYSIFCIKELYKFIDTKYLLLIQYDGYVVDGSRWQNEFYDYDYIGGVCSWPDEENKGGNGGVSFRSKKLLEKAAEIIPLQYCHPEDVALSSKYKGFRKQLENHNLKFADNSVQQLFSYEDWEYRNTFAHHKGNTEIAYYNKRKQNLENKNG